MKTTHVYYTVVTVMTYYYLVKVNIWTTMFMVLLSMREFTQFIWRVQHKCQAATHIWTKPINLSHRST